MSLSTTKPSTTFPALGDRVQHEQYGAGTVTLLDVYHTVIDFDGHGLRRFVTQRVVVERTDDPGPTASERRRPEVRARSVAIRSSRPPGFISAATFGSSDPSGRVIGSETACHMNETDSCSSIGFSTVIRWRSFPGCIPPRDSFLLDRLERLPHQRRQYTPRFCARAAGLRRLHTPRPVRQKCSTFSAILFGVSGASLLMLRFSYQSATCIRIPNSTAGSREPRERRAMPASPPRAEPRAQVSSPACDW